MKMKLGIYRAAFLAIYGAFILVPIQTKAQTVKIKLASAYAEDNLLTKNIQQFAEDVRKATNGRVDISVYPKGSLFKSAEIFDGVKDGTTAQAGEVIMSNLSKENVLFGADSLPFFVNTHEDAQRLWKLSRPAIEKALDERGIVPLYAAPWPPQQLYSNRPIASPQDFRGLRMRSYSIGTEKIAQTIGAKPVTIEMADLAKKISDKEVDMMIMSSWAGVDSKAWVGMKYFYKVNAWIPKNIVFINKSVFSKIDSDSQKKLMIAAQEAEARGWNLSKNDAEFEGQLASHGLGVEPINPYVRGYLDQAGEKLAREYLKSAQPDQAQVLSKILVQYTMERSAK